ncbi:DUF3379 domain-containing protein [Thalassomonas viridans]|uniref:DUF3379 domain-containing protein n=1 Tax=Thalassomonas viridans TaxID=137584 RepID=A0AAE9YZM0_9GAMM|nr:DUF3379 family protein [Thalassomonas viridans]WDE03910.1 DUF3379 domain-containing protein [Thalassomonas viridans]
MDDLQFRRSIYADPKSRDEATQDAIDADPAKQQFVKDIEALDEKLARAMKVPVPDDLYDKLILRQTLDSHRQQKRKTRIQLAMAASVAFALGLTFNFMQYSAPYSTMGDYALAHVYHEEGKFSNDDEVRVSLATLNNKMSTFNGTFDSNFGELISAQFCPFQGIKSLHLVFQGKTSPVTVLIVPNQAELEYIEDFSDDNFKGKTLLMHDNNVIVIGDKNEPLEQWQDNIRENVSWSI